MDCTEYERKKNEEIKQLIESSTYCMNFRNLNISFDRMARTYKTKTGVDHQELSYPQMLALVEFFRASLTINLSYMAAFRTVQLSFNRLQRGQNEHVIVFFNIDRGKNEVEQRAEVSFIVPIVFVPPAAPI